MERLVELRQGGRVIGCALEVLQHVRWKLTGRVVLCYAPLLQVLLAGHTVDHGIVALFVLEVQTRHRDRIGNPTVNGQEQEPRWQLKGIVRVLRMWQRRGQVGRRTCRAGDGHRCG